jgi:hypothetical protein
MTNHDGTDCDIDISDAMAKCECGKGVSGGRVQWSWLGDGHCDEAYGCR